MVKLSVKQQRFCDEYIKTGNAKQAAIKAGYSAKSAGTIANENLNKPYLRAYINEIMEKKRSKSIAGTDEILDYLTSVMRGEQTESVAISKGVFHNVPVGAKDRISAAKELLKRYPSDPIGKATLRKLNADARVAEARAKSLEDNGQDVEKLLDKMIDTLDKADEGNGNK